VSRDYLNREDICNMDVPQTLLYFYSSVAQSMAALFAVGGIFAVYSLQTIDNELEFTKRAFAEFVDGFRERIRGYKGDVNAKMWLGKDFLVHLAYLIAQENKTPDKSLFKAYQDYQIHFKNQMEYKNRIKKDLLFPTILIALNFINALLFLPYLDFLLTKCRCVVSVDVFLLILSSTVIVIYLIQYISFCLQGSKEVEINNPKTNIKNW